MLDPKKLIAGNLAELLHTHKQAVAGILGIACEPELFKRLSAAGINFRRVTDRKNAADLIIGESRIQVKMISSKIKRDDHIQLRMRRGHGTPRFYAIADVDEFIFCNTDNKDLGDFFRIHGKEIIRLATENRYNNSKLSSRPDFYPVVITIHRDELKKYEMKI